MNINVNNNFDGERYPSLGDDISEHQAVMSGAGYPLTGRVALVAEDQEALPGSYRVWLEITGAFPRGPEWVRSWVWVDDEGVVHNCTNPMHPDRTRLNA